MTPDPVVEVATPRRLGPLIRRLSRVRRGNAGLRRAGRAGELATSIRPADRWAWLREVVLPEPRLAPAGLVYAAVTMIAAGLARVLRLAGQAPAAAADAQDAWKAVAETLVADIAAVLRA